MTKKDYIKLAATFAANMPRRATEDDTNAAREFARDMWTRTVHDTADMLQRDNVRFDRRRFLKACGIDIN